MQKNYKENHLKSYAVRSINSKGRIYKESEKIIGIGFFIQTSEAHILITKVCNFWFF
jgi:hypothetical protein